MRQFIAGVFAGAVVCAAVLVAVWSPWDDGGGWRAAGRIERPRPHNLPSPPACGWAVNPEQTMRVVVCPEQSGYRCYYASPGRSVNEEGWWIDSRYAGELSKAECAAARKAVSQAGYVRSVG